MGHPEPPAILGIWPCPTEGPGPRTNHQWVETKFSTPVATHSQLSNLAPPTSILALAPESSFMYWGKGKSPGITWALAPPTSRTMLGSELPWTGIQHHKDFIPTNQWPAATAQSRTWQPTGLGASHAYPCAHYSHTTMAEEPTQPT